jgi:SAM-dependent methyltransferase
MAERKTSTNYFTAKETAAKYARYRPYFHPKIVAWLGKYLTPTTQLDLALDVGCGTGQSSVALAALAANVLAVDPSPAMLAEAKKHSRIDYRLGSAEALDVETGAIDLVSAGLAFHWFNREPFMTELRRVLRPKGHFLRYDCGFSGAMVGNPDYAIWNASSYARRFPTPSRDTRPFTLDDANAAGFELVAEGKFTHIEPYSPSQLAGYLMTQSNVAGTIDSGMSTDTAERWLIEAVSPFFSSEGKAEFRFVGTMQLLCKRR